MKEGLLKLPPPLDALMIGLEKKAVTNFYGGPGTGKTNVCLIAALECIRNGGTVVYVDSEGGFSVERLRQMESNADSLLERIRFIEPKTFEEQGKAIRNLEKEEMDMIIVDSMVALYRIEYSDRESPKSKGAQATMSQVMEANRELAKQLSILSNIARERDIPVLITAHVFSNWETGVDEVIGGESIKYWSKAMVNLERTSKMSERKAMIKKHRHIPEGGEVKFMIINEGIKPSSGFKLF